MRTLIVYESMFGNTHRIAEQIVAGFGPSAELSEVAGAGTDLTGVDLLIVGGPTHAFGLSRPSSRAEAAQKAPGRDIHPETGLREWLETLPSGGPRPPCAVFDTRVPQPVWLVGSAARRAAKVLRHAGFRLIAPPESFFVTGTLGPLADREADRAREWGGSLARLVPAAGRAA